MKSNSGRDFASSSKERLFRRFLPAGILSFLIFLPCVPPAAEGASIAEIARLSASDRLERPQVLDFFRGSSSLGLRREAAEFLGQRILLGEISREEAAPLFEEILADEGRQGDAAALPQICETAFRAGVRTPMIQYAYGTALRLAGRHSEGSEELARVETRSPLHPYAVYGIGQIAAVRGDDKGALEAFRQVHDEVKEVPGGEFLAARATRSRAELLLAGGRPSESAPLFLSLLDGGEDPYDRIGSSLSGGDNVSVAAVPVEAVAKLPPRERILYNLLLEGLSRERGQYEMAVTYADRANEESAAVFSPAYRLPSESPERDETGEFLDRQTENHRVHRGSLLERTSEDNAVIVRDDLVELMAQLLFLDHSILRAWGTVAPTREIPGNAGLSAKEIEGILTWIAKASLDGVTVDRLVEEQAKKLDLLQNLPHPIQRYRLLARLEKGQTRIYEIAGRIRQRRESILRADDDGKTSFFRLLSDLGRYLKELESFREAAEEVRGVAFNHFNILRETKNAKTAGGDPTAALAREALAFDNDRFVALLPAIRLLKDRARIVSRERTRKEILDLQPVILLHLVDSLTELAKSLAAKQPPGWSRRYRAALSRAASYLGNERLTRDGRIECAIRIGSALTGGIQRWQPYPEGSAGEDEFRISEALLPILSEGADSGNRQEESLYMLAIVRMFLKDAASVDVGRKFLGKYPSSQFAGEISVRLGNIFLLEGKAAEAIVEYRKAADGTNREAAGIARYAMGSILLGKGDMEGAIRELAIPLSDPSFSCVEPAPFEESVLSLAVRAWKDAPSDRLASYPPVRKGGCGGKLLLTRLGEAAERRGENARAANVYDTLSGAFAADRSAVRYETRAMGEMLRAGRDEEALSRAIRVKKKYGLGAGGESPAMQDLEMARKELAEMLATLAERTFEEGIRTRKSSALALSAAAIGQLLELGDAGSPEENDELLLKRSVALIRSGSRVEGIALLEEMLGKGRRDEFSERAALLYAETMIGAYERKEETALNAEGAAWILLEGFPSGEAAVLGCRSAAAFLQAGELDRAVRIADAVEKFEATPPAAVFRARLIRAEVSLFAGVPGKARTIADSILAERSKEVEPQVRARARDVFLLSCLKIAEAGMAEKDWKGASVQWEELENRFPDVPEAPLYAVRAFQSYRMAGDAEGVIRVGLLFLRKFPGREETIEIAEVLGRTLEGRKEYLKASEVYASVAESFPGKAISQRFLFLAARMSYDHGDLENAGKRFSAYRSKYANPRWMTSYAALAAGYLEWKSRRTRNAIREMEEGLRIKEAGVEPDAPGNLDELAWMVRIAIGEYWSEQFRALKLVAPLEKSLAVKNRFFRRALSGFEKTEEEASLELAVTASQLSGDLLVEFGKSILSSEIPRGMKREEREKYEEALKIRARAFLERALDRYSVALDRLDSEKGPSDLAASIRQRMEAAQMLLPGAQAVGEGR